MNLPEDWRQLITPHCATKQQYIPLEAVARHSMEESVVSNPSTLHDPFKAVLLIMT